MNIADDASFIAEALPAFVSEAHEQIGSIEQLLLELEDKPDDRELLDALFRCAHTVKGSAGIFGLHDVVAFTHHVETLLDRLREGEIALTPELSTVLLRCNDQIRRLVEQSAHGGDPAGEAERSQLIEQLTVMGSAAGTAVPKPAAAPTTSVAQAPAAPARCRVSVDFARDTFRQGMDPLAILNYLAQHGRLLEMRCREDAVPPLEALDPEDCHFGFGFVYEGARAGEAIDDAFSFVRDDVKLEVTPLDAAPATPAASMPPTTATMAVADAPVGDVALKAARAIAALAAPATPDTPARGAPAAAAAPAAPAAEGTRYIRVQADRLDAVINLLGELVIASAGATLMARRTRQGDLIEANEQITRLVEDIRNGTLQLRMVPIGETFSRFRRVVRDTAADLGKDVALDIVGGDTELDKSVVERIADPLMHLVRNALDHGLETPAQREAAGKPAQGRLTLAAFHESGTIVIRIVDDGRGIQRQRVLERAWERGLVERGVVPDDERVLQLIFEPGFSTAEKVTNLSGRGVGMDVVRSNIEALRGSVTLASEEGRGSTIEIRLPLTLAIIDGFLVGVGESKFVFPLESVVEVIEDRPTTMPLDNRGRGVIELRGRPLPLLGLRQLYALDAPPPPRCSVVVIRAGTQRFGVLVDVLLGQHQTVIKPLGRMFRSLRGMSGSTILGNGEVALIFDVAALSHLAAGATARVSAASLEKSSS